MDLTFRVPVQYGFSQCWPLLSPPDTPTAECGFHLGPTASFLLELLVIALLSSLVPQTVKNPPAQQETRVQPLGWEDPLEKEMATHSRILAWRIPWTEEPGELQTMGSQRVRHMGAANTHTVSRQRIGPLLTWEAHLPVSYLFAFHTVHGVLVVKVLEWPATPSCRRSHFVRTLHYVRSVLDGPAWTTEVIACVTQAPLHRPQVKAVTCKAGHSE